MVERLGTSQWSVAEARSMIARLRHVATDNTNVRIVGPITKGLACGDVGVGAMAEVDEIAALVRASVEA